jgi:hypothetical protein
MIRAWIVPPIVIPILISLGLAAFLDTILARRQRVAYVA